MMKQLTALSLALAACSLPAQTDPTGFHPEWFATPQLSLRPITAEPTAQPSGPSEQLHLPTSLTSESDVASPPAIQPLVASSDLSAEQSLRDFDLQVYYRLEKEGYFTLPSRSESRFERAMQNIFAPEVIRFRKVEVSCSIITAIKRKNPLCLINPCVLNVSW